ncbi:MULTISPECIES: CD1871A family CXXC motif-containing protein [Oscillospiraceae]|nr:MULTISPECIES: CD1871A family CXXC motif-containing protein [Oscillospiraceae]
MKRSSVLLLLAGAVLIAAGVLREEHVTVLHKGVNLCLECVGIG